MKKICSGARRDEGIKWFTELSDKGTDVVVMIIKIIRVMIIIVNACLIKK